MKDKFLYGLFYTFFGIIACLPFWLLYLFADILSFLLYHVFRYRRKVVSENLKNSFPNKTEKELHKIEKQFYRYISDYFVEEIKLLRMSNKQLLKRMEFINDKQVVDYIDSYGGVVVLIPHYANFEWTAGLKLILGEDVVALQVYKPIKAKYMDRLFNHIRSRFGGVNVAKHSTARELIKVKHQGKKIVLGLIADQNPSKNDARYWTTFLNQDTVFMDGGERIAKMMNFPVFYCDLERVKRGYSKAIFTLISDTPKETPEGMITEYFAKAIEKTIDRNPAYWFWSHKRWKHKREDA